MLHSQGGNLVPARIQQGFHKADVQAGGPTPRLVQLSGSQGVRELTGAGFGTCLFGRQYLL